MDATMSGGASAPSGVMRFFGKDKIPTLWAAVSALGFVAGFRDISKLARLFFMGFDGLFEGVARFVVDHVHLPFHAWVVKEVLIFSGLAVFAATGIVNIVKGRTVIENSWMAVLTVVCVSVLCFLLWFKAVVILDDDTVLNLLTTQTASGYFVMAILFGSPALISCFLFLAFRYLLKWQPLKAFLISVSLASAVAPAFIIVLTLDDRETARDWFFCLTLAIIPIVMALNPQRTRQVTALVALFMVLICASTVFDKLLPEGPEAGAQAASSSAAE